MTGVCFKVCNCCQLSVLRVPMQTVPTFNLCILFLASDVKSCLCLFFPLGFADNFPNWSSSHWTIPSPQDVSNTHHLVSFTHTHDSIILDIHFFKNATWFGEHNFLVIEGMQSLKCASQSHVLPTFSLFRKNTIADMPLNIEIGKSQFSYIVEILSLDRILKQD